MKSMYAIKWIIFSVILVMLAGCSSRSGKWIYGVHWYANDLESRDVEELTGEKGIHVLEIVVTDPSAEDEDQWQAQLDKFQTIVSRGHTLIIRVQPNWGKVVPHPDDDYSVDAFAADCARMAQGLSSVCRIWQIGNEMNILQEYGDEELAADYYVDVYRKVRTAIHSAESPLGRQRVLLGPVSPGGIAEGVKSVEGNRYLSRMLENLTPSECDGFALHGYAEPCPDWECGLEGFKDLIITQLQIIDQMGFRKKPVYITEFNKHMPIDKPGEETIAAGFIQNAYRWMNAWNRGSGNHNIIAACWFVFPEGRDWDDYSLEYWKTSSAYPNTDVWQAYQAICNENIHAGKVGGGMRARSKRGLYFYDDFSGNVLDMTPPLPDWHINKVGEGLAFARNSWLVIKNNKTLEEAWCEIITRSDVFDDITLWTEVYVVDGTSRHIDSSRRSFDIRFRASDSGGYALTFHLDDNAITLRDLRDGSIISECVQPVIVTAQCQFKVFIRAIGDEIEIKIDQPLSEGNVMNVLHWIVRNDLYRWGWVGMRSSHIAEIDVPYFGLGGPKCKPKVRKAKIDFSQH